MEKYFIRKRRIFMQTSKEYRLLCDKRAPKSKVISHSVAAFLGGGFICAVGELLSYLYISLGLSQENAYLSVTLTFIVIASLLTGIGVFDKITNLIYAGTLVPVTGFSNAVTSAAIDTRNEGYISGVGSKIFTVSGPVILFAALSGFLYGLIYFLLNLFF